MSEAPDGDASSSDIREIDETADRWRDRCAADIEDTGGGTTSGAAARRGRLTLQTASHLAVRELLERRLQRRLEPCAN